MRKVLLALIFIATSILPAQADSGEIKVMTRNLYLGADVGVAMELIPDFSAAAQFMWKQVAATDFPERAPKLAAEAIAAGADVIGLQEATNWYCKKNFWSKKVVVYNFTEEFLKATKEQGSEYVLASKNGVTALNIGYSIPAIPYLTMVNDPQTFQPLFGSDSAACGFEIGDAIAIKKSLLKDLIQVGNSEYEKSYTIIARVMSIYRGYTWIDLDFAGKKVRIVSTHLESLWDKGVTPNSAIQVQQLIGDLSRTTMPIIVMGDFNSDPRDPRPNPASNPGGQPESSSACPAQVADPTKSKSLSECNPYWLMSKAGFIDVGPDPLNPRNYSWGMNALLTGPDTKRLAAAKVMGNNEGFTDRLDYIFTKNGAHAVTSQLIGNKPPQSGLWPSDHAGLTATIALPASTTLSEPLDGHQPFPISFWNWVGIGIVFLGATIFFVRRRSHQG
jgi:endonuclease/exonuclease/phosphatase family metal-dependent hydrolase